MRWFVRIGDAIIWADSPQDLAHYTAPNEDGIEAPIPPKSVTFVPVALSALMFTLRQQSRPTVLKQHGKSDVVKGP